MQSKELPRTEHPCQARSYFRVAIREASASKQYFAKLNPYAASTSISIYAFLLLGLPDTRCIRPPCCPSTALWHCSMIGWSAVKAEQKRCLPFYRPGVH